MPKRTQNPYEILAKAKEITGMEVKACSFVNAGAILKNFTLAKDKNGTNQANIEMTGRLIKNLEDETFGIDPKDGYKTVIGPMLEPYAIDAHDEWQSPEAIASAFEAANQGQDVIFDKMHDFEEDPSAILAKSWLLEDDWSGTDKDGEPVELKKGSWMMAAYVKEDTPLAKSIESNEFNGWSAGGACNVAPFESDPPSEEMKGFFSLLKNFFRGGEEKSLEKGAFNDGIEDHSKMKAAADAFWLFDDVFWNEKWDGSFQGMIEAAEEFTTYLKGLDSQGQTDLLKTIKETRGGNENMPGITDEVLKKALEKAVEPLTKKIEGLEGELKKSKDGDERKDLLKTLEDAEVEIKPEDTNQDLKKAFILKKNSNINLEGMSEEGINAAFEMAKSIKPQLVAGDPTAGKTTLEKSADNDLEAYGM